MDYQLVNVILGIGNHIIILFFFVYFSCFLILSFFHHQNNDSDNNTNDNTFSTVVITLYQANGCFSYLMITYSVYYNGYNLLSILKSISTSEDNLLISRGYDLHQSSVMNNQLRSYCWKWLLISFFIAIVSISFFYVVYGSHADTHFFNVGNNEGWRILSIAYLYVNVGWLIPLVLVRVGSHFLERRILRFVEYLENPKDHLFQQPHSADNQTTTFSQIISFISNSLQPIEPPVDSESASDLAESNISITQVLSWYDDLYALNQTLSNALSPLIFQAILFLFPVIIFILEVCPSTIVCSPLPLVARVFSPILSLLRVQLHVSFGSSQIALFSLF